MRQENDMQALTVCLGTVDSIRLAAHAAWSFLLTDTRQVTRFASTIQRLLILALQEADKESYYGLELSKCLTQLLEERKYDPFLRDKVEATLNLFNRRIGYRFVFGEGGKLQLERMLGDGDHGRKAALTIVFDPHKSRMYYGPPTYWPQLSDAERLAVAKDTQPERRYLKEIARREWEDATSLRCHQNFATVW